MATTQNTNAHLRLHNRIIRELVRTAGVDPHSDELPTPSSWSATGVQHMNQLAGDMHSWIDSTVEFVGIQLNELNPVNRLPAEVLCMVFRHAAAGEFVEQVAFAAVCRRWRAVSLENGSLFSKVSVTSRSITPRVALREVARRLEYTGTAPADVTLRCEDGAPDMVFDPLEDHMSHIRTLKLHAPPEMLQQNLRASLTMPAPSLVSLEIVVNTDLQGDDDHMHFPGDLFSGDAPKLKALELGYIAPPAAWPPLHRLQRLSFVSDIVRAGDLVRLLRACRSLDTLSIKAAETEFSPAWDKLPMSPLPPRRLNSAQLIMRGTSVANLLSMLSASSLQMPRSCYIAAAPVTDAREWLIPPDTFRTVRTLHIYQTSRTRATAVRVVTKDANHLSRSGDMKTVHAPGLLQKFRRLFPALRRLSIGEQLWPTPLPRMPLMEELTVVLEQPSRHEPFGPGVLGIFYLPLAAGTEWDLPALRILRLAYISDDDDDDDGDGDGDGEETSTGGRGPLVIPAHNVTLFLTWHLRSQQPLDVVLSNVRLFEPVDHPDTQRLLAMVGSLDQQADYNPEGYELGDA